MSDYIREYYTEHYRGNKDSDTPRESIISLARRSFQWIKDTGEGTILDIGAGKAAMEYELRNMVLGNTDTRKKLDQFHVVSLDLAEINPKYFRRTNENKLDIEPVQADSRLLPFRDGTFDRIVSNLALEFGGEEAFIEASRVLADRGTFSFNLQDPSIFEPDDEMGLKTNTPFGSVRDNLKMNSNAFTDETSIRSYLLQFGLNPVVITRKEVRQNDRVLSAWWEVDGTKNTLENSDLLTTE